MTIEDRIPPGQRRQMIAEAAYFRAERRGFNGGDPLKDWIAAEAEVDARLRRMESDQLVRRLEEGLTIASKKLTTLKKKISGVKADARVEWREDVEKLAKLRDSLQTRLEELREHGEQAGRKAHQQAERVWQEMTDVIHRLGPRPRP